jgi:hypothetical protein
MPARIPDDSPNIEEVGNAATNGASDNTETFQSDAPNTCLLQTQKLVLV